MPRAKLPIRQTKVSSKEDATRFPPVTVTSPSLLVGGSDAVFREFLTNLLDVGAQVHELRSFIAKQLGVPEPQYRLVLAIAQLQKEEGVSVSVVAERLWVSTNYVTMEVRKLQSLGWIEKRQNPEDGRGVLMRLTAKGREAFTDVVGTIQLINDTMFDNLTTDELEQVSRIAKKLVQHGRRALDAARASAGHPRAKAADVVQAKVR